jgi:tetratricopeptide (TPR) repeat protein
MHPGISQAIQASTRPDIQAATDTELAAFWTQSVLEARQRAGGEVGQAIIRASLAAAPYVLRLKEWETAGSLLEQVLMRDQSSATIQAALPALRAVAGATKEPRDLSALARALMQVDRDEAEELLRVTVAQAAAAGDFRLATSIAGDVVTLLRDAGRLREALDLIDQKARYTRQAKLGPWTQLADEGRRLQILGLIGEHQQVLDEVRTLRARMDTLPAAGGSNENVEPWSVRELILNVGHMAAAALGEWPQALDLNAAVVTSTRARVVSTLEIARARFNDYGPLLELGRLDEVERLLLDCQQAFEDDGDLGQLALVLDARAALEDKRGNLAAALAFHQTALRFGYARPEALHIARYHHALANDLARTGTDPEGQRAHRLAAALIFQLSGMTYNLATTCQELAGELRGDVGGAHLPGTLDEVVRVAEQTEGVHLGRLISALARGPHATADALAQIFDTAAAMRVGHPAVLQQLSQHWEQWEALAQFLQPVDWADELRGIHDGEEEQP